MRCAAGNHSRASPCSCPIGRHLANVMLMVKKIRAAAPVTWPHVHRSERQVSSLVSCWEMRLGVSCSTCIFRLQKKLLVRIRRRQAPVRRQTFPERSKCDHSHSTRDNHSVSQSRDCWRIQGGSKFHINIVFKVALLHTFFVMFCTLQISTFLSIKCVNTGKMFISASSRCNALVSVRVCLHLWRKPSSN